ncbi:hypothetical protein CYCD_23630 [Tenuifilaceae bacterium CYCD]|nr:hypothetical protein CYCD_23630 [Tenuifilaceae bacterium CYCD]
MKVYNVIEFIKDNQWIFWMIAAIGTVTSNYFLVKSWLSKRTETNRKIYENTIESKYHDLFEFKKSIDFSPLQMLTDDNNLIEISIFCQRIEDFKKQRNTFKGCRTKILFNKLYNISLVINKTKDNKFMFNSILDDESINIEFYEKNKNNFEILKKHFKSFYLKIFDNL